MSYSLFNKPHEKKSHDSIIEHYPSAALVTEEVLSEIEHLLDMTKRIPSPSAKVATQVLSKSIDEIGKVIGENQLQEGNTNGLSM